MKVLPKIIVVIGLVLLVAVLGSFGYYWLTEDSLVVRPFLFYACMAYMAAVVVYFLVLGPKLVKILEDQENLQSERQKIKDRQGWCEDQKSKLAQKEHELEKLEKYLRDGIRLELTGKLTPEVKAELASQFKKEVNREVRDSKKRMLDRDSRLNLAHRHITKSRVQIQELRAAKSQLLLDLQKSQRENGELSGQVKHLSSIVEQRKNWDNETAMKMIPHLAQSTLLKALHRRKDFADLKAKLRSGR